MRIMFCIVYHSQISCNIFLNEIIYICLLMETNVTHIENGIHDISNDEYHASDAVSRSALMELDKSPLHYYVKYITKEIPFSESTGAMNIGSAFHTMVLEPSLFDEQFFVCKQKTKPRIGTPAYEDLLGNANGRIILNASEYNLVSNMSHKVKNDDIAKELFAYKKAQIEKSIFWTQKETGIQCKARPDIWLNGLVVDLKTTSNASLRAFRRSAYDYGYFLQAAMIHEALKSIDIKLDKFVYIAVEKDAPHHIGVFVLDDDALDYGVNLFNTLISKLKGCMDSNNYPGYGIKKLTLSSEI